MVSFLRAHERHHSSYVSCMATGTVAAARYSVKLYTRRYCVCIEPAVQHKRTNLDMRDTVQSLTKAAGQRYGWAEAVRSARLGGWGKCSFTGGSAIRSSGGAAGTRASRGAQGQGAGRRFAICLLLLFVSGREELCRAEQKQDLKRSTRGKI